MSVCLYAFAAFRDIFRVNKCSSKADALYNLRVDLLILSPSTVAFELGPEPVQIESSAELMMFPE